MRLNEIDRSSEELRIQLHTTGYETPSKLNKDRFGDLFTDLEKKVFNDPLYKDFPVTFKLIDKGFNLLYNKDDCEKVIKFFLKNENVHFDLRDCDPTNQMVQLFHALLKVSPEEERIKLQGRLPGSQDIFRAITADGWAMLKADQIRKNELQGIEAAQQKLAQAAEREAQAQAAREAALAQRLREAELARSKQTRPQTAKERKDFNQAYHAWNAKQPGAVSDAVSKAAERLKEYKAKQSLSSQESTSRPSSATSASRVTRAIVQHPLKKQNEPSPKPVVRPSTAAPSRGERIKAPQETLGSTGIVRLMGKGLEGVEKPAVKKPKFGLK